MEIRIIGAVKECPKSRYPDQKVKWPRLLNNGVARDHLAGRRISLDVLDVAKSSVCVSCGKNFRIRAIGTPFMSFSK